MQESLLAVRPHPDRRHFAHRPSTMCFHCHTDAFVVATLRAQPVVYFRCDVCGHHWSHRHTEHADDHAACDPGGMVDVPGGANYQTHA